MDALFEFLFKYRPLVFEQGEFALGAPGSLRVGLLAAGIVGAIAVATYTLARADSSAGERTAMAGLRVALLAVLLFCLLRPTLVLSTVVPQQNFLGILVDDSRSMQLADQDGVTRGEFVREAFDPETSQLLRELGERFTLRFFRFASDASRLEGPEELTFEGTHTDLGSALDVAREELSGVPLSGLVLLSDGADNTDRPVTESLVPLQASGVPVFTVGLGEERVEPDIELGRVELPRAVLEGSSLMVDVVVTQTGFGRATVPVIIEDDRQILAEEEVTLGPDGEPVVTRMAFQLDVTGPRRVRFRIPPQEGERVQENNARDVWIEVQGNREKILYLEGEPRFEVKFTRRAVADDENLQVVTLLRTAENKFYRMSVDDPEELAGGFPRTRAELFQYRALILGSVEASFFTQDQLQMIADFVSERGGGLLMLGGRSSFAEGGWDGTAVAEVLPVVLQDAPVTRPGQEGAAFLTELDVSPTPAGQAHAALQLGEDYEDPVARWEWLPPLTGVNRITEVKPGATALLTGALPDGGEPQVVLAHQRYGRGKALAFTAQDSWTWQMHADVPVDDNSHETFWRQILRWLVDGVPEAVSVTVDREQVESGQAVGLVATVGDSTYLEVNDARVEARITRPTGLVDTLPLEWTVERDGEYRADVVPLEEGDYEVEVVALRGDEELGRDVTYLHTAPSDDEYFGAGRRTALLQRIADETEGRYYSPSTLSSLPDDISVTGAGVTLTEERDLWDMPALFLLMITLMGAEWGFRRLRGMA